MRGVGRFRKLLLGFVTSILIVNPIFATDVFAYEPSLGCLDASLSINDPAELSIFTITIECSQQIYLVNSENNSENIVGITLNDIHPTRVDAVGSKLKLTFNYLDFSVGNKISLTDRSLNINAGLLMDDEGVYNDLISLNTLQIIDKVPPLANPNQYEVSGTSRSVAVDKGLLANDVEYESLISEIKVDAGPKFGKVDVKSDGSFVYTYDSGRYGDDEFYYHSIDSSGNVGNSVVVKIVDAAPEIKAKFYNSNSADSIYAKPGDLLRLDFSVSGDSIIEEVKICGNSITNYSNLSPGNFRAEYTISSEDSSGWCLPWIQVHDLLGQETTFQGSDAGLYLDKTNPVIELLNGDSVTAAINEGFDYLSKVSAYDVSPDGSFIAKLPFTVAGVVDFGCVGVYRLVFRSVDRAGNTTIKQQIYHVYDPVNDKYSELANELYEYGISSNLSDINDGNYGEFKHLFFEKIINNKKMARIEFYGPIDIARYEDLLQEFIKSLPEKFIANNFGEISMDLSDFAGASILTSGGVKLKFYNLNEIGYSNGSNSNDIIDNIVAYDDAGQIIDTKNNIYNGLFVGCIQGMNDCYSFSTNISHFSKYIITRDRRSPAVSIDKIKNYRIGEKIYLSGNIDDVDANLVLIVGSQSFVIPKSNILNGRWYLEFKSDDLLVGKYPVTIVAYDFGQNKSSSSYEMIIINKEKNAISHILSRPASISNLILGDKIKGETKSTAVVMKDKSNFGLDKNEVGLIVVVLILGLVIFAVDRRLS